jgi:hypothetical protein
MLNWWVQKAAEHSNEAAPLGNGTYFSGSAPHGPVLDLRCFRAAPLTHPLLDSPGQLFRIIPSCR